MKTWFGIEGFTADKFRYLLKSRGTMLAIYSAKMTSPTDWELVVEGEAKDVSKTWTKLQKSSRSNYDS